MKLFSLFGEILIENNKANQSLDDTEKKGALVGNRFGTIGKAAAGLTLGLAAMGAAAVTAMGIKAFDSAKELNQAMNNLQAQTGAAESEMSSLHDTALAIYNDNFGEDFNDIADAMANVKQITGETGDELKKSTENALLLRDTFEFDVNESTRTANSLMKQFGITSDQAFTLIAQGAQNGANKNGDLLDTLNEYAPQFKNLGFSADQFTNILIDGAANGAFSIDKVGDAVKEFNIRAKDMSKTSIDGFQSLGLGAEEMSQAFAAGGESAQTAFSTVIQKLQEIKDPVEQNRIGVELFGTQFEDLQAQGILALGSIGDKANSTADTLQKINNAKYDNIGSALAGIGRNLETGILIPLGEKVLPKLNEFAGWIQAHMPEIQAGTETAMDIATELFNGFGDAIHFVTDHANIIIPVLAGVTGAIVAQAAIEGIITLYKTWQEVTKTQTALQWLLNAAMDANPLGLLAAAIGLVVAAGVLLYENWDTVKEKLGELWDWMKEIGGDIGDFFSGVFDGLVKGFKWYVNQWIDALNFMIRGLDKIHFKIPEGVPFLGGTNFGINIQEIPHLEKGTDSFAGGLAVVGEKGRELVRLPEGSQVVPHDETEKMLGGVAITIEQMTVRDDSDIGRIARELDNLIRARSRGVGLT